MEPTSKERILKKIRKGLIHSTSQPFPNVDTSKSIYHEQSDDLSVIFAEEFSKLQGNFIFCESEKELMENINALITEKGWNFIYCWEDVLQKLFQKYDFKNIRIGKNLEKSDVGITLCEFIIARTGTIMLSSKQNSGRALPVFPPAHLVIAYTSQLVYDIKDAIHAVTQKYEGALPSMISFVSGPSRTADIEKTLVLGAHGPKEVYLLLIDDSE